MRGHVEMDTLNVHYVHNRRFYFAEFKRERETPWQKLLISIMLM